MQLDKRKVESAICSKGFRIDNDHHHFFIYHTIDGRRTSVRTHTSHSPKGGLNDFLIGRMSKQCKLRKPEFLDLVNCPLTQSAYEKILHEQNFIPGANPETHT